MRWTGWRLNTPVQEHLVTLDWWLLKNMFLAQKVEFLPSSVYSSFPPSLHPSIHLCHWEMHWCVCDVYVHKYFQEIIEKQAKATKLDGICVFNFCLFTSFFFSSFSSVSFQLYEVIVTVVCVCVLMRKYSSVTCFPGWLTVSEDDRTPAAVWAPQQP